MTLFSRENKDKTRPSLDDLARYVCGCLRARGHGNEAIITWRWKFGSNILSISLESKDIKPLS